MYEKVWKKGILFFLYMIAHHDWEIYKFLIACYMCGCEYVWERGGGRKKERHRECVWHVYLLHFSPKPLLTVLNWNTESLVFVFHSTNSCFSTVMSWLEVVISFNICVCVMCTLGQ